MIHCLHEKFLPLLVLSSQGCPDAMHYMHVIVWFPLGTSPPSPLRCHDRPVSWNEPQPCKSDALSVSQPSSVTVYCILQWQHRQFTHHEILWFSPSHRIPLLFPSTVFRFLTLILLTWRIWWAPNYASKRQMGSNSAFKGLLNAIYLNFSIHLLFAQIITFFRLPFIILFRFLSFLVLFLPFYLSFSSHFCFSLFPQCLHPYIK